MTAWALVRVGCIECSEPTRFVGVFESPAEAAAEAAQREGKMLAPLVVTAGEAVNIYYDEQWVILKVSSTPTRNRT